MRAIHALPLVASWLTTPLLLGCPPTLSRPHSEEHLDALATGERHTHHGRHDEAAESFDDAARTADRRVDRDEALYRASRSLRRDGHFVEAVARLDEIAATEPPSRRTARAIHDASRIRLRELDQRAAARAGFERVVRQHSDEGPAAHSLRLWLEDVEEVDGADAALALTRSLYADLHATDLGDDLLAFQHELLLEAGDRQGARAALERIVRDHPYPQGHRWDDAIVRLAEMDEEDGDLPAAIARLEAMLQRAETTTIVGSYTLPAFPVAALRIARLHRELGETDDAESAFWRVYRQFDDSILRDDALVELAEMRWDEGEREDACELFARVLEEFEVGAARRRAAERAERCE